MEELSINPTIEWPGLTQDWENRLLEGTNKTLCAPRPRRKEQCPHKTDWPRLACECPGVSGRGVGRQWPTEGSGELKTAVHAQVLLKEAAITILTATIVWPGPN